MATNVISKNEVVRNALNAMSDEEFNTKVEEAFKKAAISSLKEIEKGLLGLSKVQAFQGSEYEKKPKDFKSNYIALLRELSHVQAMIHHLSR